MEGIVPADKIGIAGTGGIGSNVAVHLVRCGIKHFKLVDFDFVDESNLNRQFFFRNQVGKDKVSALEANLKRIGTGLKIEKERRMLTAAALPEVFKGCAVIVEGFDNPESKAALVETFAGKDAFVVSACGVSGFDIEGVRVRWFGKNVAIVGDFRPGNCAAGFYSPKVSLAAAVMANLILKRLGYDGV